MIRYTAKPGDIVAYCWASGKIEFTRTNQRLIPKDALPIIAGPKREVRALVNATSRIAHDGRTLLVPGIPEAELFGWDPVVKLLQHCKALLKSKTYGPHIYKALPVK